jgi:uncharacterized protein YraI
MLIDFRAAAAGAFLAAATVGTAAAYPATVTTDLNLRAGPGVGYGVVATMPAGARVNVGNCLGNGWCRLRFGGVAGYASGSYLARGGGGAAVVVSPTYVAPEYYAYAYRYPPYWRNGYFYYWYGGYWRHVRRPHSWWLRHRNFISHHRRFERHQRRVINQQQRRIRNQRHVIRHERRAEHHAVRHARQATRRAVVQHRRSVRHAVRHARPAVRHARPAARRAARPAARRGGGGRNERRNR